MLCHTPLFKIPQYTKKARKSGLAFFFHLTQQRMEKNIHRDINLPEKKIHSYIQPENK